MKTVVVIVESDVLNSRIYLGRSGDGMVVNFFFNDGFRVILVEASSMQRSVEGVRAFLVKNIRNSVKNVYNLSVFEEYKNVCNGSVPSNGVDIGLFVEFDLQSCILNDVMDFDVLFSRAMPQSLTKVFLQNFEFLARKARVVPQDMRNICLYKDKVIPYLLQEDEERIGKMCELYGEDVRKFKDGIDGDFSKIAIETDICDITNVENVFDVEKVCVKPFNLFGGIGIGVFEDFANVCEHLKVIEGEFERFGVKEKRLVLLQRVVKNPEFGDIRPFFSCGKFIGVFKRFEPVGKIHNTINGAKILPICDENFVFAKEFQENLKDSFVEVIKMLEVLFGYSKFLRNEVIAGCDLLLDGDSFKLTEINVACPTGFVFLEATNLFVKYGNWLKIEDLDDYFLKNGRIIERVLKLF